MTTHNYVVRSQRAGDRDELEREEQAAEKRCFVSGHDLSRVAND